MVATPLTEEQAWSVLRTVPDPEIPVISITELGIVREILTGPDSVTVVVTPTYSGCPATEVIAASICDALEAAGAGTVHIETRLSPPWTTDWLTPEAAEKLRSYGIAPPGPRTVAQTVRFVPKAPKCPRCGEKATTRVSQFGSTACKAMYRCPSCLEPFEYFKPI
jgi:ring-1,2-phenylacetyl-CoA epoxidase subunit PaaD